MYNIYSLLLFSVAPFWKISAGHKQRTLLFVGYVFYICLRFYLNEISASGVRPTHIYIYVFSRRFYPKRLTIAFRLHIFCQYMCSLEIEPTTFCTADTMLYHWATQERMLYLSSVYSPKLCYAEPEETNCWIKLFCFLCTEKVFSSLHNIQIEPLMADGLFWWCFSYFSRPWQCYLFGSQWDSHKPPGFHPKYLKLCSEDERNFYGFGTTWGKWLMTKFSFWGGVSL